VSNTVGARKRFSRLADRATEAGVLQEYQVQSKMPGYRITLYFPNHTVACKGFPEANQALDLALIGYGVGYTKGATK